MTALLLALAITVAPAPEPTQAEKLALYITTTYHGADSYALELATRILHESRTQHLDPALLAAIAHTESFYQLSARGTSGELGIFQILPTREFRKMSRVDQEHWARDIVYSTWRAATILAYHIRRCGAMTARCASAYNSGNHWHVRRGYVWTIRKRARAIRKAMR